MKIFSAAQIKACDAYTIHASGITSLDLTERAAIACAEFIIRNFSTDTPFVFLCGMGNNGADGLALAMLLMQHNFPIKVFVLQHRTEISPENKINLNRILKVNAALVEYVEPETFLADLPPHVVIIDAVLGIGLSRSTEGWMADFFAHINQLSNRKIAIDIPSGMPADTGFAEDAAIILSDITLSFQFYKRSFLHPESAIYCGKIHLLDIGLHPAFIDGTHTHYQTVEEDFVAAFIKKKDEFSYKNQHGHVYIIGGSMGKGGAAILATKAALRSGVGLVTAMVPGQCYHTIQIAAPEAMTEVSGDHFLESIDGLDAASAIGIGMGMGTENETVKAFSLFIEKSGKPLVIDADGINILAMHQELMNKIPENSILTPHVGECDRLFGKSSNSFQRVENLRMQAMRYKITLVLKGHRTVIVTPDGDCFYNMTGNAGMAKGGSGDVLTGLLAGLLAQGYKAEQAALLGVYLHGLSGDIAANYIGMQAMNAGDIIQHLSGAWQKLAKM